MAQPRFGELLWQAVMQVKASKGRSIASIKHDLAELCYVGVGAVEKWKKRSIPATETVEILARFGVREAGMERVWLRAFLRAGEYYDGGALEQDCFSEDRSALPTSRDNLPPLRSDFIGRTVEIGRVRKGLAMPHPLVSIEGIGGVGKTTLAIKVARLCKSGEINDEQTHPYDKIAPFEAIVWISAKDKPNEDLSLSDVLDAVAGVLNVTIVRQLQGDEKRAAVDRLLRTHRSLLIVDNFETVSDVKLADFLQSIPPPSKAIITTRQRQLRRLWDVPLAGLSEKEGLQKIRDYSYSLGLRAVAHADDATLRPLYSITEGNPKAIEMALGYIKYKGMALDEVVHSLAEVNETVYDLFQDLFARAWELLSQEGQRLLMVMPFFADSANRDAIEAAADVHGWYLRMGLSQLIEMSLLETTEELVEARKRYSAHPLVIAFAGAKLREQQEFETEARERWVRFYRKVATQAKETFNYPTLRAEANNLFGILDWLMAHHQMGEIESFLSNLCDFMFAEGHWEPLLEIADQVISSTESLENPRIMRTLLQSISNIHRNRLAWEDAQTWLERAQIIATDFNDALLYAEIELANGRHLANAEGIDMIKKSLTIFREHNQYASIVQALNSTGNIHLRQRDFEEAKRCYQDALQILDTFKDEIDRVSEWKACLHGNLSLIVGRQGDYAKVTKELYKLLAHFTDQTDIAETYAILAFYELKLGHEDQAYLLRQRADQIIERLGWVRPICTEDAEWMKLHNAQNKSDF